MLKFALPLTLAALSMAAATPKTFSGVVEDHARMASRPAQQCPVIKIPKYTLQTSDGAWILSDEKLAAPFAGKRVRITGTVMDGNKLHVLSIAPAASVKE